MNASRCQVWQKSDGCFGKWCEQRWKSEVNGMKAVENWVRDIVFYMIFVTMVMNLAGSKYEKYLRLLLARSHPSGVWTGITDHGDGD